MGSSGSSQAIGNWITAESSAISNQAIGMNQLQAYTQAVGGVRGW
jgi:hypothetical protein